MWWSTCRHKYSNRIKSIAETMNIINWMSERLNCWHDTPNKQKITVLDELNSHVRFATMQLTDNAKTWCTSAIISGHFYTLHNKFCSKWHGNRWRGHCHVIDRQPVVASVLCYNTWIIGIESCAPPAWRLLIFRSTYYICSNEIRLQCS